LYIRCNAWNDFCCGRRPRVLSDKRHRDLLSRCRETGQYCIEHGLVFPFEPPVLEEPYEPRIREMEDRLNSLNTHPLMNLDTDPEAQTHAHAQAQQNQTTQTSLEQALTSSMRYSSQPISQSPFPMRMPRDPSNSIELVAGHDHDELENLDSDYGTHFPSDPESETTCSEASYYPKAKGAADNNNYVNVNEKGSDDADADADSTTCVPSTDDSIN